jgi:serine/threonine protein kinase
MLPLVTGDRVVVVSEDDETGLAQVETSYCEKGLFPSACIKKAEVPVSDEKIPWSLRWRIALDIAKGLSHLHSFQPPIVHRDLRSPNIFVRPSAALMVYFAPCVLVARMHAYRLLFALPLCL